MARPKLKLEDIKIGDEVTVRQLSNITGVDFYLDNFRHDTEEIGIGTVASINNEPNISAIADRLFLFKNFEDDFVDEEDLPAHKEKTGV